MKLARTWFAMGWLALIACGVSGCALVGRGGPAGSGATPPASGGASERGANASVPQRKSSRVKRDAAAVVAPVATSVLSTGSADRDETAWREALAREPGNAAALTRLSRLLYQQRRHAEALELLAPVRDGRLKLASGERAAALAGLAMHEAALGHESEAIELLSALPEGAAPGVAAFLAVRGADTDSALTATERALRTSPESAALRNNRGIALLRSGDAEAARVEFERAIALDPSRPGPYYNLAILERFYRLDTDSAQRWFREAWSRSHADPDSLRAELGRGRPAAVAEGSGER